MTSQVGAGAETLKLARLLHVEPERLAYLESLTADELRAVRERATDALFHADRDRFQRVAAAAKLPPIGATAALAQKAFGPLLVARVAALTETARAIEIAERLEPGFLADVAVEIDPRRSSAVIAGIPPALTGQIAAELCRRGEHVAMGRFVGHLSEAGIVASLEVIDDAALLRISYVLEERHRLDAVVRLLGPERRAAAIRAASEHDLWPETLDLITGVGDELRAELADLAAAQDEATLTAMVEAVQRGGLWPSALAAIAAMSPESRRRVARLRVVQRTAIIESVAAAAAAAGSWSGLLAILAAQPPSAQRKAWRAIVALAADMSDPQLRAFVGEALDLGADNLVALLLGSDDDGGVERGVRVVARLGARLHKRLAAQVQDVDMPQRERALAAAREAGLLDRLGPVGAALAS